MHDDATGTVLEYRVSPFGHERYELTESSLAVSYSGLFESGQYTVDLATLDPVCSRLTYRPPRWMLGTAVFGLLVLWLIVLVVSGRMGAGWFSLALAIALCGEGLAVYQLVRQSRDVLSFHRLTDGAPTVNLHWLKPDADAFRMFVDELQFRLEQSQIEGDTGTLAAELIGINSLRAKGLLSEDEYRAAKAKLLDIETWQLGD